MTYKYFLICSQQIEEDSLRRGNRTYGHRCVRQSRLLIHNFKIRDNKIQVFKILMFHFPIFLLLNSKFCKFKIICHYLSIIQTHKIAQYLFSECQNSINSKLQSAKFKHFYIPYFFMKFL